MTYFRFPETKIWKVLFAVFLLAQLLLTRSGMSGTLLGFVPSQVLMLVCLALAGMIFVWANRTNMKSVLCDRRMGLAAAFAVVMLLPMLIKQDWQLMYFTILLGLLLAVFLSYFVTLKETAKCYVLLMCALGVYSILATYLLRRLPDNGILEIPVFVTGAGHDYYHFGLCYVSISHVASRNFGVFREPGVYQFFLLIALYLTTYCAQWKKEYHIWLANSILAVTMLTTMATGGVIALGLFIIVAYFEKKMYRDKRLLLLAVLAVCAAAAVVIVSFLQKNAIYWFLYNTLLEKFINRTDSVTERAAAIEANLQFFFSSPLVGARLAEVLHGAANNTVSTLILYAVFGIFGGTLHVACWVALVWKKERQLWANLALLLVLFMGFNTQNLTWDLYFWLFPAMALVERVLPMVSQRKMKTKE